MARDSCVGTDTSCSGGWSVTVTATDGDLQRYYAVATDRDGLASLSAVSTTLTVHTTPSIGSFSADPSAVVQGTGITLTASGISTPNGYSGTAFYRETNGQSGLNVGADQLLSNGSGNSLWISTSGWTGVQTFYVRVTDSDGNTATASTTVAICPPSSGASMSASPATVAQGEFFTLTAHTVGGDGRMYWRVILP